MDTYIIGLLTVLATALGGLLGRLIENYRSRQKTKDDHSQSVSASAKTSIDTASSVMNMLQEMLQEERTHFDKEIGIAKSSCSKLIAELKSEYDDKLSAMKDENEKMAEKIGNLDRDNTALTKQIVSLTQSNTETQVKFKEVKERLSKYESVTTDDLNKVVREKRLK